jgi:thioredoxin:protein disulfide reductase
MPMRSLLFALMLLLSCVVRCEAQDLLEPEKAFRFSARLLEPGKIEVRYDIAPGYYLYREKFKFSAEPASIDVDAPNYRPVRSKRMNSSATSRFIAARSWWCCRSKA